MMGEQINSIPANKYAFGSVDIRSINKAMPSASAVGCGRVHDKPVRSRELLECMQRVLAGERGNGKWNAADDYARRIESAGCATTLQGKNLLVEDNLVNKRCVALFGTHGPRYASLQRPGSVNAFSEDQFNFLMDVQMPIMMGSPPPARSANWKPLNPVKVAHCVHRCGVMLMRCAATQNAAKRPAWMLFNQAYRDRAATRNTATVRNGRTQRAKHDAARCHKNGCA